MTVTVRIILSAPTTTDGTRVATTTATNQTAKVCIYLHDKNLADAAATLVSSQTVDIPVDTNSVECVFTLDNLSSVTQIGKTMEEMQEPTMYAALDISGGTVTYAPGSSPAFGIQMTGGSVEIKVKAKDS